MFQPPSFLIFGFNLLDPNEERIPLIRLTVERHHFRFHNADDHQMTLQRLIEAPVNSKQSLR